MVTLVMHATINFQGPGTEYITLTGTVQQIASSYDLRNCEVWRRTSAVIISIERAVAKLCPAIFTENFNSAFRCAFDFLISVF